MRGWAKKKLVCGWDSDGGKTVREVGECPRREEVEVSVVAESRRPPGGLGGRTRRAADTHTH